MQKGFTLIELLIVIGIIIVMAAVAVPRFDNYGSSSEVVDRGQEIGSLIEKGIARSIGSEVSTSGTVSNGTLVKANLDSALEDKNSVTLYTVRYANPELPTSAAIDNALASESIKLPDYMHLKATAGSTFTNSAMYAYFVSPGKYVKESSLTNNFSLTVTSDKTSKSVNIIIIYPKNSTNPNEMARVVVNE